MISDVVFVTREQGDQSLCSRGSSPRNWSPWLLFASQEQKGGCITGDFRKRVVLGMDCAVAILSSSSLLVCWDFVRISTSCGVSFTDTAAEALLSLLPQEESKKLYIKMKYTIARVDRFMSVSFALIIIMDVCYYNRFHLAQEKIIKSM